MSHLSPDLPGRARDETHRPRSRSWKQTGSLLNQQSPLATPPAIILLHYSILYGIGPRSPSPSLPLSLPSCDFVSVLSEADVSPVVLLPL